MARSCLLFFFFTFIYFSATAQDPTEKVRIDSVLLKKVSADYQNASIKSIITDFGSKYGLKFSYAGSNINLEQRISIHVRDTSLFHFLNVLTYGPGLDYSLVASYIVLFKPDILKSLVDAESEALDSVPVFDIQDNPREKNEKIIYKLSLLDLVNGANVYDKSFQKDSVEVSTDDSVKVLDKKQRRKRIRLIRKQYRSEAWSVLSARPEISMWRLRGTTNQSIDYGIYNDYGNPDLSFTIQAAFSRRVINNFFIQPGLKASYLSKKGTHTDYQISFLQPGVVHKVSYEYESRFIFADFTFLFGYEHKVGKNKLTLSGGYFIGLLIKQTSPKFFPYFETKYYLSGPPYYNSNYERIVREEIPYREFIPGVMGEILYYREINKRIDFMVGLHTRFMTFSIYKKTAPISERALTQGLSLGLRYNFK